MKYLNYSSAPTKHLKKQTTTSIWEQEPQANKHH